MARFFEVDHQRLVTSGSEGVKRITQGGERFSVSSAHRDVGTRLCKHFCGCFTDAFARPANKGMLSAQSVGGIRKVRS